VLEQKQHTIDILSIDIHCASQDSLQFAPKGQRSRNSSAQAIKQEIAARRGYLLRTARLKIFN
jgi:hypothetical protein